jgi:membrane fusion protein (multidrug efflux system)
MSHPRSHQRGRSLRTAAAFLAGTIALGLVACGDKAEEPAAAEGPPALTVGAESIHRVATETLSTGPTMSGSLEPVREATVHAEVPGSVVQTMVEEGQAVGAGAVLARIDDSSLRDGVLSAQSGVRSAEQQLTVARRNAERSEALVKGGALPEREAETARWNVTNAEAMLADSQSRLTLAREQLDKTIVRAPFPGTVSKRAVATGDTVQPGKEMFTLVDPSRMRLEAQVPAERLAEITVGAPVDFTVSGYPGQQFRGEIERINPVADAATRQVAIYVALPNDAGRLVAGLYAEGRVAALARSVLAVPASAIDRSQPEPAVLRVVGGKVERVPVRLGITDETSERVEVVDGLAAGDVLLVGAARAITPGATVELPGETTAATPTEPAANPAAEEG